MTSSKQLHQIYEAGFHLRTAPPAKARTSFSYKLQQAYVCRVTLQTRKVRRSAFRQANCHLKTVVKAYAANCLSAETTASCGYGLEKKTVPAGSSPNAGFRCPDTTMMEMGGHFARTAAASFRPSIEPGISMSVNTMWMSLRVSRIRIASSASLASIATNPASSTRSTAAILRSGSSSTINTMTVMAMKCSIERSSPPRLFGNAVR